jgi:hypothetical protein
VYTRKHREHQSQRRDLGRDPTQIAQNDESGAQDFDSDAESISEVVTDREQIHFVESRGKEKPDKHQTHRCTEGVFDHSSQTSIHKFCRDPQDRLCAKPSSKTCGNHHDQRQSMAGHREVRSVFDTRAGPCTDEQSAY